jgi:hypothetical protein
MPAAPSLGIVSRDMEPSGALLDACRERVSAVHAVELLPRFDKAIARYPLRPPLLYSMGVVCLQFGYVDLWKHYTAMAFSMPHASHQDVLLRGEAKIRLDDWSGWVDREARLYNPREMTLWAPYARDIQWTRKAWFGDEVIADKVILVITDGGFGDCIQMLRFIPVLASLAGKVIVAVYPQCVALARAVVGHVATVTTPEDLPGERFDRYTWLMSLAAMFGSLPPFDAFRAPTPMRREAIGARLPRIGMCWAGHSNQPSSYTDRDRSISLDDLAPLLSRDDLDFYSLQVGRWASDAARYPHVMSPAVSLTTFAETANVMSGLDAVVTVDTSVAHLAGNVGVPTVLLLHCAGDFRWGMYDTTAWYPTMRILRQPARSDWSSVVKRLIAYMDARDFWSVNAAVESLSSAVPS